MQINEQYYPTNLPKASRMQETLNVFMCVDSITNNNENKWKLVKTGENGSKWVTTSQNRSKFVNMGVGTRAWVVGPRRSKSTIPRETD